MESDRERGASKVGNVALFSRPGVDQIIKEERLREALTAQPIIRTDKHIQLIDRFLVQVWPTAQRIGEARVSQVSRAARFHSCSRDEKIVEEGERGLTFFILVSGTAEVFKHSSPGKLATLKAGSSFGEASLGPGAPPRNATIVCSSDLAELLVLHKADYDQIMKDYQKSEHRKAFKCMKRIPLFRHWSRSRLDRLCDMLQWNYFKAGTVVVRQGDLPDNVYFILDGRCVVSKDVFVKRTNRWPSGKRSWVIAQRLPEMDQRRGHDGEHVVGQAKVERLVHVEDGTDERRPGDAASRGRAAPRGDGLGHGEGPTNVAQPEPRGRRRRPRRGRAQQERRDVELVQQKRVRVAREGDDRRLEARRLALLEHDAGDARHGKIGKPELDRARLQRGIRPRPQDEAEAAADERLEPEAVPELVHERVPEQHEVDADDGAGDGHGAPRLPRIGARDGVDEQVPGDDAQPIAGEDPRAGKVRVGHGTVVGSVRGRGRRVRGIRQAPEHGKGCPVDRQAPERGHVPGRGCPVDLKLPARM